MSDAARKKTVNLLKEKGQVSEEVLNALLTVADGLNEHLHIYVTMFGPYASTDYMQGVETSVSFICNVIGELHDAS